MAANCAPCLASTDSLRSGIGEFVDEYVFPGGELTHVAKVVEGMGQQGLELIDAEALREHYAKTLWNWVDRLESREDEARREVGDERFRIWRIYMAGSMTEDQFAEALCQLVGKAEDAGLGLPQIIRVLVEQIDAMREVLAE